MDYLHAAGNSIDTILRIDTSIANAQIERFLSNNNVFVPQNTQKGKFIQFAGDNLDIIEETIDGKGTFHVTQMAMFQRGPIEEKHLPDRTVINRSKVLKDVPEDFHKLASVDVFSKPVPPKLDLAGGHFSSSTKILHTSEKVNTAFILSRLHQTDKQVVPAWTVFNQTASNIKAAQSIVGYLPIIQAPAHEMDTMMTVLLRCKDIAKTLSQPWTVVTFDQALYYRAK